MNLTNTLIKFRRPSLHKTSKMSTWGTYDNQTYLHGIRTQDDAILTDIFTHIRPPMIRELMKMGNSLENAEDIFSDALVEVFIKVNKGQLRLTSSFAAYLLGIGKNLSKKLYKRNKIKERVTTEALKAYEENDLLPDERLQERTVKNRIQKLFLQMDKACRQVIMLFWEGNEHKVIQELMGYGSEGYTRKRKHNCQKKLEALIANDPILKEIYKS